MYLQKQEIKSKKFTSQQKKLNYLFDNKKIQQFIAYVQQAQKQHKNVPQLAIQISHHFKQINKKCERALQILRSSKFGWKLNKIDSKSELGVRVSGTNVQLRYEGQLTTNIQNLCVMIYQVNNFNKWVPFCTRSQDLAEISPIQKTCYMSFKIPFLTERYAYFYALGIDKIDYNGTIVIYGQGITQNKQMLNKFNIVHDRKKLDKLVVMDIKYFICQISYKSENQFKLKSYSELDSHIPILPEWLISTVIKQMGGFIFQKIIKQSMNLKGTVWQKHMKQDKNNPFYSWLHQRIQGWHQMNKKKKMISKI